MKKLAIKFGKLGRLVTGSGIVFSVVLGFSFLVLPGCEGDTEDSDLIGTQTFSTRFETAGPYASGNTTFVLYDAVRDRTLTVEAWYPAAPSALTAAAVGEAVTAFVAPEHVTTYSQLLADAPADGPTVRSHSARGAELATVEGTLPVLQFSHCMNCMRFEIMTLAQHLASHGFVVIAQDHAGGTIFESLKGEAASLSIEFLDTRARDVTFVTDRLFAAEDDIPEVIRGQLDANRLGMFGHSFGGATAGAVLNRDNRFKAGAALAVPFDSPVFPGVDIEKIQVPVFMLLAKEDNMIFEAGNIYIRKNWEDAVVPAWKAEVTDAGHMSMTDICRITPDFHAGCGDGDRMRRGEQPFTYIDQHLTFDLTASYLVAFFTAILDQDASARLYMMESRPADWVVMEYRDGSQP